MTSATAVSELSQAWTAWHADRERELATPHGWLSLTGFSWLTPTPAALLSLPGRWSANGVTAVLQAAPNDRLVLASGPHQGDPVDGADEAAVPEAGALHWVRRDDVLVELVLRGGRYAIRVRDPHAPELTGFTGVPAFPVDADWVKPGRFTAFPQPRTVTVATARADLRQQITVVGVVEVEHLRRRYPLVATAGSGGRLNLSFRDATNGDQTARWRVVSTSVPTETGSLVIDFNRAVNLPFAFTEFGTCPAPAPGNDLPFGVTAGEKAPVRVTP